MKGAQIMLTQKDFADIQLSWLREKMAQLYELLYESAITYYLVRAKHLNRRQLKQMASIQECCSRRRGFVR
jgi:hypothetical protein